MFDIMIYVLLVKFGLYTTMQEKEVFFGLCFLKITDLDMLKVRLYPKWHTPQWDVGLLGGSKSKISKSLLEK